MKRILFVGDLRPHTRTSQRLRALLRLGHQVHPISTHDVDSPPPGKERLPLLHRLCYRLGRPRDANGANAALLEAVLDRPFDVLWVEKAPCLHASTLTDLASRRPEIARAFFSEDDMTRASNGSAWFRSSIGLYDVVFTTKSHNAAPDELPALGAREVGLVSKTYDPLVHRPVAVTDEERRLLGGPIGFIGTFEEARARALLTLARSGLDVRVWGNGWSDWAERHARLHIEDRPIYGDAYVRSLCATDVNLGFLRKASRDEHTDRSVEIPACGAFLLAERTTEHQRLFREGTEAEFFGDFLELSAKVHRYLADPGARREVARAGRLRCESDDYSHDASLTAMLARLDAARRRRLAS